MNDSSTPIIDVRNLTVGYGEGPILNDVSFRVHRGEVFIILGGSGCGKSTLLKHMIGLFRPYRGAIFLNGQDIVVAEGEQRHRILRQIGVSYQSGALFGSMTLLENVCLPLDEFTTLPRDAKDLLGRMKLKLVGLQGFENHLPSAVSGGMQKRAAIARAIALDPAILFLDEPSAGLDPVTSAELDQLILNLAATLSSTFVIVSHELPSIFAIADHVIMLDKQARGIIAEGLPAQLRDHSPDERVRRFFNRQVSSSTQGENATRSKESLHHE